ncbi:glycosyltransferase [Demequina sp.]|uniref:glycosyltransferase n=1 Tax=Demequina sp. TaxID=2050685 RepID=UPI003D14B216
MALPRALVVATTYPARPGDGTPAFVRDLCLELSSSFEVTVLVPAVRGAPSREQDGPLAVVRHRYFPRRWETVADGAILENVRASRGAVIQVPFLWASQWFAVRREFRRVRPSVVHAHWLIPAGVSARALSRRVPLVVTTLGGDLYALNFAVARWLKRRVAAAASVVTVMNSDMAARAASLGARDVRVMPMGARFSVVTPAPASGPVRLLAVGRLVEKKGFDVLLRALEAVPHAVLTIVGDGPSRGELEAAAHSLGARVTFAGQLGREELDEVYRHADIAVFPSRPAASGDQDGLPVAMLEAMGSGLAVIASDLAGLNEAVVSGESGLLVPPGDAGVLAAAISELAADPSQRRALGEAAAIRARGYSVEAVGAGYRALLHEVIEAAKPSPPSV